MTGIGITRRHGRTGLYRRDHDLGGTEWSMLLSLDPASATHLHDHGRIVPGEADARMHGDTPGIVIGDHHIEARHALGRPESAFARAEVPDAWALHDEADGHPRISKLWLSDLAG